MEALAPQEEDDYPDDGAMEGSGDDYEQKIIDYHISHPSVTWKQ
jgi:hypothetical protein